MSCMKKGFGSDMPVLLIFCLSVMNPSPQHMAPFQLCPEPSMKKSVVGLICRVANHVSLSIGMVVHSYGRWRRMCNDLQVTPQRAGAV